ncbi:hypothetical protein [Streptomyces sp. 2231.1]|uniref:hypothetical protein n=1 Tax=Streptomyces sp. 2231.1 TaxID=1855347 RepID=UPI0035248D45
MAAQDAGGSVRYYCVPVAADSRGASFTVTGAPGVVAAPARAKVPKSPYGVSVPDGDLSGAVKEFLDAYLSGAGEVDRYLAPGLALAPVSPRAVCGAVGAAGGRRRGGRGRRGRAGGRHHGACGGPGGSPRRDGRWPLAYELILKARSGRWEVAAVEAGAAQGGGVR